MSDFRAVDGEFLLDTPRVRDFVAGVQAAIAASAAPEEACEAIRPSFAALLADPDWLQTEYTAPVPGIHRPPPPRARRRASPGDAAQEGMGGGIGQWLLYRADDASLSLFSLVVPSGAATPVHDHLAWGLVGLYRGTQEEEIYRHEHRGLRPVERRALAPGDFYALIPPHDDIHRVRTTSPEASVSIHLLTNDTGCVWRHTFEPGTGTARPFRSGYANAPCEPAAPEEAG